MRTKMSYVIAYLLTSGVFGWSWSYQAWAVQSEAQVACAENIPEPVALTYGAHTATCEINPTTESDTFRFIGSQQDHARFVVQSETDNFDPRIEVYDPNGIRLIDSACIGRVCGSATGCFLIQCRISEELTLPLSGTYTVVMSAKGADKNGGYTVQLERISPALEIPRLITSNLVSDEVNPSTDVDFYTLTGGQGNRLRFTVRSGTPNLNPRMEIYDPAGVRIADKSCTGRICGSATGCYLLQCSFTEDLTLQSSGAYTVAVSVTGGVPGSYQLNFECLFGNCDGSPSPSLSVVLESPLDGQVVSGVSLLRGWAFGPVSNPVSSIKLIVDGTEIDDIPFPSKRGDVAAAFPQEPNALRSGFGSIVNYSNLSQGPHTIEVRVIARDGTFQSLTRRVVALRFSGFQFVGGDLSSATAKREGNVIIVQGVQVQDKVTGQRRTVTVRLKFDEPSQGFIVTDIQ